MLYQTNRHELILKVYGTSDRRLPWRIVSSLFNFSWNDSDQIRLWLTTFTTYFNSIETKIFPPNLRVCTLTLGLPVNTFFCMKLLCMGLFYSSNPTSVDELSFSSLSTRCQLKVNFFKTCELSEIIDLTIIVSRANSIDVNSIIARIT